MKKLERINILPIKKDDISPVEFANKLLKDFEIVTIGNDELCWQLAGTEQKYSSQEIYKKLTQNDYR